MRIRGTLLLIVLLLGSVTTLWAVTAPALEKQVRQIASQLRCPV